MSDWRLVGRWWHGPNGERLRAIAGGDGGTGQGVSANTNAQGYDPALVDVPPGTPGAGSGLWGWSDMFRDPYTMFKIGYGGSEIQDAAKTMGDYFAQRRNAHLDYARTLAGSRAQVTTGGSVPPAQLQAWDPRSIGMLLQLLQMAGARG